MTSVAEAPPIHRSQNLLRMLKLAAVVVGLTWLWLTVDLVSPLFSRATTKVELPQQIVAAHSVTPWHAFPIQDGRIKPFETASMEIVRQITGRERFSANDPVAIVLAWWLSDDESKQTPVDWEEYPFILCDHHELRREIYHDTSDAPAEGHRASDDQIQGKYISPADLRRSVGFEQLLAEVAKKRSTFQGKAHLYLSTTQLKAEEVIRRLTLYDSLCGQRLTRLRNCAVSPQGFINVPELAERKSLTPEETLRDLEKTLTISNDPLRCVSFGEDSGMDWRFISELRLLERSPVIWRKAMKERVGQTPEKYLGTEHRKKLDDFQQALAAGRGEASLDELTRLLDDRRREQVQEFDTAQRANDTIKANAVLTRMLRSAPLQNEFREKHEGLAKSSKTPEQLWENTRVLFGQTLAKHDELLVDHLRNGVRLAQQSHYRADAADFRVLHREYLETCFPDLYEEIVSQREFPDEKIQDVLEHFAEVRKAYQTANAEEFQAASNRFLALLTQLRGEEGVAPTVGIARELAFNHLRPFRLSWILMLVAMFLLLLTFGSSWRVISLAAFGVYGASLAMQTLGFVYRVTIAGRAPVANMYETVIFVAYLAAVFALVLEWFYRRRVIALAGALVATLGLILADQLPLALDPKISPMVPVLRTNFWLTVHVLTIVASYAGGTLAWGLGNITLGVIAFGKGEKDTLRMLSQFTYRAMQIAVLLLATGTFLGGCWAAESWGRFWGWDPKEVGALVALVCYVIPLHARYIGWVKDFGLAVSAVLCYASIILSWYVINFLLAAGLHSYGFSSGGSTGVLWAVLLNLEWVLVTSMFYLKRESGRPLYKSAAGR